MSHPTQHSAYVPSHPTLSLCPIPLNTQLMYGGDDKKPASGRLELRLHDGSPSHISEGFLMENTEQAAT